MVSSIHPAIVTKSVFTDPFRFDIERAPNDHLAFGYGGTLLWGASLARLEMRIFFEQMILHMPALELISDKPPRLRASNFITGIESLPVRALA